MPALQSYGDVQTLYTGTKAQGKVMVTFYDCVAAAQAFAALNGRTVNGRTLHVDFHTSQKDAQSGRAAHRSRITGCKARRPSRQSVPKLIARFKN